MFNLCTSALSIEPMNLHWSTMVDTLQWVLLKSSVVTWFASSRLRWIRITCNCYCSRSVLLARNCCTKPVQISYSAPTWHSEYAHSQKRTSTFAFCIPNRMHSEEIRRRTTFRSKCSVAFTTDWTHCSTCLWPRSCWSSASCRDCDAEESAQTTK